MKDNTATLLMERKMEMKKANDIIERLDEEEDKKERKTRRKRFCYRIIDRNVEGVTHDDYELEEGYRWVFPDYIKEYLERENAYDEDILSTFTDFSDKNYDKEEYSYNEDEYCDGIVDPNYRNDCEDDDNDYYDDYDDEEE